MVAHENPTYWRNCAEVMQAARKLTTDVHCHAYLACLDPGCLADLISQGLAHDPKGGLKMACAGQLGRTRALNHGLAFLRSNMAGILVIGMEFGSRRTTWGRCS
jgi:hypothetical protein